MRNMYVGNAILADSLEGELWKCPV